MEIQTNLEGLIPKIQDLALQQQILSVMIAEKQNELKNIPDVIRLNAEILALQKDQYEQQKKEEELREQGKNIMLDHNLKELKLLDGTEIAIQFTPGSLVIEDESKVPAKYWNEKTTRTVDKNSLKKDIIEGIIEDSNIYIKKDSKFVIKSK